MYNLTSTLFVLIYTSSNTSRETKFLFVSTFPATYAFSRNRKTGIAGMLIY